MMKKDCEAPVPSVMINIFSVGGGGVVATSGFVLIMNRSGRRANWASDSLIRD